MPRNRAPACDLRPTSAIQFWQYDLATFYAELGDKDNAFPKLNQSIDDHEQFIGFMKVDPFMNPLRTDPRFVEVMKKAGLPQ